MIRAHRPTLNRDDEGGGIQSCTDLRKVDQVTTDQVT